MIWKYKLCQIIFLNKFSRQINYTKKLQFLKVAKMLNLSFLQQGSSLVNPTKNQNIVLLNLIGVNQGRKNHGTAVQFISPFIFHFMGK